MLRFRALLPLLAVAAVTAVWAIPGAAPAQTAYVPKAQFCVLTQTPSLCSTLPGNIGPDPALFPPHGIAYSGLPGTPPPDAQRDVQTPFDNLSWQSFVALNWTAGKEGAPPSVGLAGTGPRVWETYARVSQVFGNSAVQANCTNVPTNLQVFSMGSTGHGYPLTQNEEYIQAATGDPLIDVSGNWTIYERRVNAREAGYLKAPLGAGKGDLTTQGGQLRFVANKGNVDFPSAGSTPTGAIEIKAAWRILDPKKDNLASYYVVNGFLKVSPDLTTDGRPICQPVTLGLVAMHIIQKNPPRQAGSALLPQWFWSTFEHVDNAPMAFAACDPARAIACPLLNSPSQACPPVQRVQGQYSYYNTGAPNTPTNQPPVPSKLIGGARFSWNPTEPFAQKYMTTEAGKPVGTQVSRCWQTYSMTRDLNTQWRAQLKAAGSPFQNYMLVGTQWAGDITNTPTPKIPSNGVPSYLSNTVVETYIQTSHGPGNAPGSCVACHQFATLPVSQPQPQSDLSFLPGLAQPDQIRRPPLPPTAMTGPVH
ncbi:MAG TPA: hypothetical protein VHU87_02870 [Rhizomicrobium sp.]|jgi:hypothetical protein|nr:hypothetical protein [Rhizomicrobium sp.]